MAANKPKKSNRIKELIQTYFTCYETSDKGTLETLLDDSFEFSSPHDKKLDKISYFRKCWGFNKYVKQFQIIRFIQDTDKAIVIYRVIAYDNSEFENAESFEIKNDKIYRIKVYYGDLPEK